MDGVFTPGAQQLAHTLIGRFLFSPSGQGGFLFLGALLAHIHFSKGRVALKAHIHFVKGVGF